MAKWSSAFRYALRTLGRQPTFVLIALMTLALGIGANTAIFSIIKTVVLNPLPYDDSAQIVVLWEVNPEGNLELVSVPTFQDWQKDMRSLEAVAAYRRVDFTYAGTGEPQSVSAVRATPELFAVLKAHPQIGRTFTPEEAVLGADRVVVLSHGFWRRELGSDPAIVGKTLTLDAQSYTVVGVMPPAFQFPTSARVEAWTPLAFDLKDIHGTSRRARSLTVVGRMRSGSTVRQAQEEFTMLAGRIASEYKASNDGWGARVIAAHEQLVAASRPALVVLMGAVGFLLLIVCANMANLMLARLSSRRREIAVRAALGGGRWDVARPIVAESLLLSTAGGALGLVASAAGLRLLSTLAEGRLPRMEQVRLDSGVLLFTLLVSLGAAIVFGAIPALLASRGDLREQLSESSGATPSRYTRRLLGGLVVLEVALALVLLVGAGLLTRSFTRLLQVNPGFEPGNVVAAQVFLPTTKYPRQSLARFFEDVIDRLRGTGGVAAASAVSVLPMQEVSVASALPFTVEGQPPPPNEDPLADVRVVAPRYFETLKIALVEGRLLDDRDGEDAPRVSVINQTMARRYFPEGSPIGRVIQNPHGKSTVVGVVADVRNQGLASEPKKQVYLPMRQSPSAGMTVVARADRDGVALAATMERAIWGVDAQQPIYDLSTMDQILARAVFLPRLSTRLLAAFALAALLLAALGIYGVLSYSVTERTREIGLRMALGSTEPRTLGLIVRGSAALIAAGVVLGLVASLFLARSISGILYGIGPFDTIAFTIAAVVLVAAGLGASLAPARRATRVDPIVALRES